MAFKTDVLGNYAAQAPAEDLDQTIDYSAWLGADQIGTSTWTVGTGMTMHDASISADKKSVQAYFTGGVAGTEYKVTNTIVTLTSAARTKKEVFRIYVREPT